MSSGVANFCATPWDEPVFRYTAGITPERAFSCRRYLFAAEAMRSRCMDSTGCVSGTPTVTHTIFNPVDSIL